MYNKHLRAIHTTDLEKGLYFVELHSKTME